MCSVQEVFKKFPQASREEKSKGYSGRRQLPKNIDEKGDPARRERIPSQAEDTGKKKKQGIQVLNERENDSDDDDDCLDPATTRLCVRALRSVKVCVLCVVCGEREKRRSFLEALAEVAAIKKKAKFSTTQEAIEHTAEAVLCASEGACCAVFCLFLGGAVFAVVVA